MLLISYWEKNLDKLDILLAIFSIMDQVEANTPGNETLNEMGMSVP